jgi:hypothetical protein
MISLTSTRPLPCVPSFIVSDKLLICSFRATLRRRNSDPITEIFSCPTKSKITTTHIQGACSSIRPFGSPARITLAFVVAGGDATFTAEVRTKTTNTKTLIIPENLVSTVGCPILVYYLQSSTTSDLAGFCCSACVIVF